MIQPAKLKLSICISTHNRAGFIGSSIRSIVGQLTDTCELVISDNASTDNTEQVVAGMACTSKHVTYVKHDTNNGPDRNIDRVVELARGEYCWLFSDDDLMESGAVAAVLSELRENYSVVIVNMRIFNRTMTNVVRERWINFDSDRRYGPGEADRMFIELDGTVVNLCNVVIQRQIWVSRDRQRYFGSNFIHTGVIFQKPLPGPALVIANPLVSYRLGNTQSFESEWPEIWLARWPALVDSLFISESAKKAVKTSEPWRSPLWLLILRGSRLYFLSAYYRWIRPKLSSNSERAVARLVAILPYSLARQTYSFLRVIRRVLRCRPTTLFTRAI